MERTTSVEIKKKASAFEITEAIKEFVPNESGILTDATKANISNYRVMLRYYLDKENANLISEKSFSIVKCPINEGKYRIIRRS